MCSLYKCVLYSGCFRLGHGVNQRSRTESTSLPIEFVLCINVSYIVGVDAWTWCLSEVTDLINGVANTPVELTVAPGKGVCLYVCVCVLMGGRMRKGMEAPVCLSCCVCMFGKENAAR